MEIQKAKKEKDVGVQTRIAKSLASSILTLFVQPFHGDVFRYNCKCSPLALELLVVALRKAHFRVTTGGTPGNFVLNIERPTKDDRPPRTPDHSIIPPRFTVTYIWEAHNKQVAEHLESFKQIVSGAILGAAKMGESCAEISMSNCECLIGVKDRKEFREVELGFLEEMATNEDEERRYSYTIIRNGMGAAINLI